MELWKVENSVGSEREFLGRKSKESDIALVIRGEDIYVFLSYGIGNEFRDMIKFLHRRGVEVDFIKEGVDI